MANINDAFQNSFTESPDINRLNISDFSPVGLRRSPRLSQNNCNIATKSVRNDNNGKGNNVRARGMLRSKKWSKVSVEELGQVFRDVKESANKTLNNVRYSINQKFRKSTNRHAFATLNNENTPVKQANPVKLYSPFGIETPNKKCAKRKVGERNGNPRNSRFAVWSAHGRKMCCTDLIYRFEFSSPSGKLSKEVKALHNGLSELEELERGIQLRASMRCSNLCR